METALDRRGLLRTRAGVSRKALDLGAGGAAGLAGLLVVSVGFTDGGYYGRSSTALSVALATASGLMALVSGAVRPSRAALATVAALGLLAGWSAVSSLWAVSGAGVEAEVRRCVLYAVALSAALVVVDRRRRVPFLGGLVGAITLVAAAAVAMRSASAGTVDPFYGTLLEEPVGYPNALGVLVATGVVLGIGLAVSAKGSAAALGRATPGFLVLVLGLTGSRGGLLALLIGLFSLIALLPSGKRRAALAAALFALAVGGCAWAALEWTKAGGPAFAAAAGAVVAASVLSAPSVARLGGRAVGLGACGLVTLVLVGVALHPPQTSSSFRTAYWEAAFAAVRERPVLGTGAGSFYVTWRENRTATVAVRDAHSVYVETLSELGPVGLGLVLALVAVPLCVAARHRGDPFVATAAAGFVVFVAHAGIDWDWEMPVVTLTALGCAAAVFARTSTVREGARP